MRIAKSARNRTKTRGASAIEYMMIVTFVVIPLGLLAPAILRMVSLFAGRIFNIVALPFG
jgi:Flp pilus assembly pilin Flp